MNDPGLPQTASQTVGPFFHIGLIRTKDESVLATDQVQGHKVRIRGRVLDGAGEVVPDAMLEIWQADGNGVYDHPDDPGREDADPGFRGFGRTDTVNDGQFSFTTVKPGFVRFDDNQMQAPHINVRIFSRGLLIHVYTRLYFSDETDVNASDPVLNLIDSDRRDTLIATLQPFAGIPVYLFDIRMQGQHETVFFNP